MPIVDEWTHKMWSVRTVGYYSALKREEILTQATPCELEDIVLSEISQSQKGKCRKGHSDEGPRGVTFGERRGIVAAGPEGGG